MPAFDDNVPTNQPAHVSALAACDALYEARSQIALVNAALEHFEGEGRDSLDVNGARLVLSRIARNLDAVQDVLDRHADRGKRLQDQETTLRFATARLDAARNAVEAAETDDAQDAAATILRERLDQFFATPATAADELGTKWEVLAREIAAALKEGERTGEQEFRWLTALKADCLQLAGQ